MFRRVGWTSVALMAFWLAFKANNASAQNIYYIEGASNNDTINRMNLDGTNHFPWYDPAIGNQPNGIGIDASSGWLYWTDSVTDKIYRAKLNPIPGPSNQIEDVAVLSSGSLPFGITFDLTGRQLYWAEETKIRRIRMDSPFGQPEDLITGLDKARGVAIDIARGMIFWTEQGGSGFPPNQPSIKRATLADPLGSVEDLTAAIGGLGTGLFGITLDMRTEKIYWAQGSRIRRANLDGTSPEDVATGLAGAWGVALFNGWVYWSEGGGVNRVARGNLTTLPVTHEELQVTVSDIRGIAIDQYPSDVSPVPMHPRVNDRLVLATSRLTLNGAGGAVPTAFPAAVVPKVCPGGPTTERFSISIPRYLGKTKTTPGDEGLLDDSVRQALLNASPPMLGSVARLTVMSFDAGKGGPSCAQTHLKDPVYFNGQKIGVLQRVSGSWSASAFDIPISDVRFATLKGTFDPDDALFTTPPSVPTPNELDIKVNAETDCWCTHIGFVMLEFKAMSPTVLIHGAGESDAFWRKNPPVNFVEGLDSQFVVSDSQASVEPPPNSSEDPIVIGGSLLAQQLPNIAKSLGVDSIHLVAHSKGGLDNLYYLSNFYSHAFPPAVLSLTTLGSPLQGSFLVDLRSDIISQGGFSYLDIYVNFPNFASLVLPLANSILGGGNEGDLILRTDDIIRRVTDAVPALPRGTKYNTVGSDMDLNNNGSIDAPPTAPDESLSIRQYFSHTPPGGVGSLPFINTLFSSVINVIYRTLREVEEIKFECVLDVFGKCQIKRIIGTPATTLHDNDIAVTVESSWGPDPLNFSFYDLVANRAEYQDSHGKSHAAVADDEVAEDIVEWLKDIETNNNSRGDLRPFVTVY